LPAGSRRRGRPCLKEKCRRNDFQNISFVLSGRLSAQVARAVPPLIAGPCRGPSRKRNATKRSYSARWRYAFQGFVRTAVLIFESVGVLISFSYEQRFAELMFLMSTPELKGNLIPIIAAPFRRSSVTESVALPSKNGERNSRP
jgi:hypothetical protein